ncbi:glycoside hydrolase family 3 N-terminal domain-containing protein [Microbacterium sp. No. 7]|uniref:glycoside hydrolase family 3 N-terminal domain-containing protein n=1 Tax=Microbacterium sp. No. 7 TaxID=1714373 RepID=UPI0006D131BA|nr:glycoside hydrolase family 3 N-terminal domain-containing protein [Microbacterium sp. No. 7]ALJ22254.1 beta-N-acetylhexosaminidase [Microbacterium sp. No. 7]
MRTAPSFRAVCVAVLALALSACATTTPAPSSPTSPGAPTATSTPTRTPTPTPSESPTPSPTPTDPLARLTLEQRVGQLFMVGSPVEAASPLTHEALVAAEVGGAFLHGRSRLGVEAIAQLVDGLTAGAPGAPWVAADQEGGYVQALAGPGFDRIPAAIEQAGTGAAQLRADAARWGAQLREAGVTMNLAPVADIVTSPDEAWRNEPIGAIDRQYGYDADTVAALAGAFAHGMRDAGVVPTFKHFPGLGRTDENTDFSASVVDTVVAADSPDVSVYGRLLADGPAVVMMSLAVYDRIDPSTPAVFSPVVVGEVLRDGLGFDGVVITDDLSAADQVAAWSPGDRGILAIEAGVDVLLVSADPSVFAEMHAGVLARAQSDPAFAAKVDAACRRILALKADPAFAR